MRRRSQPIMSARSRVIVIAIVAIIVPTLVLSYYGVKWIGDLRSWLEGTIENQRRELALALVDSLEAAVKGREEIIFDEFSELPLEELVARRSDVKARHPIIRDIFVLDRNLEPVSPDRLTEPPNRPESTDQLFDPICERRLRPAHTKEFAENNPSEAVLKYREFQEGTLSLHYRAKASIAIAGCYFKMGRYEQASSQYRKTLDEFDNLHLVAPSMVLLTKYQKGLSLEKAGMVGKAATSYLDLYEGIVESRTTEPDEHRVEFFRRKVVDALDRLAMNPATPAELKERAEQARERDQYLRDLHTWLIMTLKVDVAKSDEEREEGFTHLAGDTPGPEPYVVAYTMIRDLEKDDWHALAGFTYNLEELKESILKPKLLEASRTELASQFVGLEDSSGKHLLGEKPPGTFVTHMSLGDMFPFWQIAMTERDTDATNLRWRKQLEWLYPSMIVLIVGVVVAGVAVAVRDITRQQHLAQLQREFVSSISHELRTPLALIRMFGEMLYLGRVKSTEKQHYYYEVIMRESERLTHLINNVLDFSRIDAGKKKYSFQPGNLAEVVRSTVEAYAHDLRKQGFNLDCQVEDVPEVRFDSDAVSQSVLNLMNNAAKYSPDRKEISVQLRRKGNEVLISVTDKGIGIDPNDMSKLFDRFYRADDPIVQETRGTGLGLSLIQHAAEAHGGRVAVESKKGKGSTFTIVLPIRDDSMPDALGT